MSALELVIDLPFLASEINNAHRQVTVHARGMLLEAKRAGDALLAAKAKVKHGEFQVWVEGHCRCSYRTARVYMQVAKAAKTADLCHFEGSLAAFLEAHAKPRITTTSPLPSFTADDAERLLKINDRVERGEGAEKAVAAAKVAAVAKEHGMAPEALVEHSKALCPDRGKTVYQAEEDAEEAAEEEEDDKADAAHLQATEARLAALEDQLKAFQRREALITKLMDHSKEELVEMLADAMIAVGEASSS